jgi:hypothetical protein
MASPRRTAGVLVLGLALAAVTLAFGGPLAAVGDDPGGPPADASTPSSSDDDPDQSTAGVGDRVTVVVLGPDGSERGRVTARVADDPGERYTGLSETDALSPDEGMLFVYGETGDRTFVMREMDFPLDIVFVHGNGTITRIHHAPVEDGPFLTRYRGRAKWVLEVNRGWTETHGVSAGDRIRIESAD